MHGADAMQQIRRGIGADEGSAGVGRGRMGRVTTAGVCYQNMGYIYEKQGKYGQALESLERAREIFEGAGSTVRLVENDLMLGPLWAQAGGFGAGAGGVG